MLIENVIHARNGTTVVKNPNIDKVMLIEKLCEENEGYCPCGGLHKKEYKCPCKMVRESGICNCGLYVNYLVE